MSSEFHHRFLQLAAAAVLHTCRWEEQVVPIPLATVVHADDDEVMLELADGTRLVVCHISTAANLRIALRRWSQVAEERVVQALVVTEDEVAAEFISEPSKRPHRNLKLSLTEQFTAVWDEDYPSFVQSLDHIIETNEAVQVVTLGELRAREGVALERASVPDQTEMFERVVFGLAQAHDLVRLVLGVARLHLLGGGAVTVLQHTEDSSLNTRNLAICLARCFADDVRDQDPIGLVVIHGPKDLADRVRQVFGKRADAGLLSSVDAQAGIRPPDQRLAELVHLAMQYEGELELWDCLDSGIARSSGTTIAKGAASAGGQRLGLVHGLLGRLTGAKLAWFGGRSARLELPGRDLLVAWVDGASVAELVQRWRLAALSAKWTGRTLDLLMEGGDVATWRRARRELPSVPEGHVFHLDRRGRVRSHAGPLGALSAPARALRSVARLPDASRSCTLPELERLVEHHAMSEFREAVADAGFRRRLASYKPWATRASIVVFVLVFALQWRWQGTTGVGAVSMGALTGEGVLSGEPWRLVSASFLHVAWWHLGLNMLALAVLGKRIEAMLGPFRFVLVFVLSCIGGSVLHELTSVPGDIALGSSTGVLGLLAAQGGIVLFQRRLVPEPARALLWREVWVNGAIIAGLSLLPFVGGMAHLGGAITGFVLTASGLACLGVQPARSEHHGGPTRVSSPTWLRAVGAAVAVVAVMQLGLAWIRGQPWRLSGSTGVVDTEVAGGRVIMPLPRGVAAIDRINDGVLHVSAGDPLRDGMHLELQAWRVGDLSLPQVQALHSSMDAAFLAYVTGGFATRQRVLRRPPSAEGAAVSRFARMQFLQVQDGVAVKLTVIALGDTDTSLLGGTWRRLPGGLKVDASQFADLPVEPAALALSALIDGREAPLAGVPEPHATIYAAATKMRAGQPAVDLLDPAMQGQAGRDAAMALARELSFSGDHTTALKLGERVLSHASGTERDWVTREAVVRLYERARDYDGALATLDASPSMEPFYLVTRAGVQLQRGDAEAAAVDARAYLASDGSQGMLSWLALVFPAAVEGDLALLQGNSSWALFLAGDHERCLAQADAAVAVRPDLTFALYNAALCSLATGDETGAYSRYRRAHALAEVQQDRHAMEASMRDLELLIKRGVPGAKTVYDDIFADSPWFPGAGNQ